MNNKLVVGAFALVALLSSCAGGNKEDAEIVITKATPKVGVVTAAEQTVVYEQTYSSTVQANVINNISGQTAGRIRKLNVEVGDFVSEGDILAELDPMQLNQARLRLKNEEVELERVKALYEEGAVSQSDFEALELSYNVSKSSYENLLENTILRAPVSGVITARNYDVGDMYAMSSPIYTLYQITPVKLLVPVSETDYTKVKKGNTVTLTADAFPGETFTGTVARVYPIIDPTSHTFKVEVQVKNLDRKLRPGMYVRTTIKLGSAENIVVPDTAVLKQQGSGVRNVYILRQDNTVELRNVTVGQHFGDQMEILSGIEVGETVVVSGNTTLMDGDKVEVA